MSRLLTEKNDHFLFKVLLATGSAVFDLHFAWNKCLSLSPHVTQESVKALDLIFSKLCNQLNQLGTKAKSMVYENLLLTL